MGMQRPKQVAEPNNAVFNIEDGPDAKPEVLLGSGHPHPDIGDETRLYCLLLCRQKKKK